MIKLNETFEARGRATPVNGMLAPAFEPVLEAFQENWRPIRVRSVTMGSAARSGSAIRMPASAFPTR